MDNKDTPFIFFDNKGLFLYSWTIKNLLYCWTRKISCCLLSHTCPKSFTILVYLDVTLLLKQRSKVGPISFQYGRYHCKGLVTKIKKLINPIHHANRWRHYFYLESSSLILFNSFSECVPHRVEICRDRHDQRLCKICASCVNFPRKQRDFLHNLRITAKFTRTKCDFALKLLRFHTLS